VANAHSASIDVPTLVMHGEDDQIVPVKDSAKKSAGALVDSLVVTEAIDYKPMSTVDLLMNASFEE